MARQRMKTYSNSWWCSFIVVCWLLIAAHPAWTNAQVQLVLRDLATVTTTSLDIQEFYIELDGGKKYYWDEVLHSSGLSENDQNIFDHRVNTFGLPLYRIRHRLTIGDWTSLSEIIDEFVQLIGTQPAKRLDERTSYLLKLAKLRARLADGNREESLVLFFELCQIDLGDSSIRKDFHSGDFSNEEIDTGFTTQILPIWFDEFTSRGVLNEIGAQELNPADLPDGKLIYLSSLHAAAGNQDHAKKFNEELSTRDSSLVQVWLPIVQAQSNPTSEDTQLSQVYRKMTGPPRAVANFVVAMENTDKPDGYDLAVLDLLFIHANYGKQFPTISSHALKLAADISEKAGNLEEANIIRSDLVENYGDQTIAGKRSEKYRSNRK